MSRNYSDEARKLAAVLYGALKEDDKKALLGEFPPVAEKWPLDDLNNPDFFDEDDLDRMGRTEIRGEFNLLWIAEKLLASSR